MRPAARADTPRSLAVYLDASAAVKLVREEPESRPLRRYLGDGPQLFSSELLEVEVRRAVRRFTASLSPEQQGELLTAAAEVLADFTLFEVRRELLVSAGAMDDPGLRSLDAVHLATALAAPLAFDAFVSYDDRQLEAAERAALPVASPGR